MAKHGETIKILVMCFWGPGYDEILCFYQNLRLKKPSKCTRYNFASFNKLLMEQVSLL